MPGMFVERGKKRSFMAVEVVRHKQKQQFVHFLAHRESSNKDMLFRMLQKLFFRSFIRLILKFC